MTTQNESADIQLLKTFNDAWNHHDIDTLMACMTDTCVFHAVAGPDMLGRTFEGHDAVRAAFASAWENFPDASWTEGVHFVTGNRGVSESTFRGTKADGSRVEARMVDVFTLRDGKIDVKNAFRKDRPAF